MEPGKLFKYKGSMAIARKRVSCLVVLGFGFLLASCSMLFDNQYFANETKLRFVNAESGEPVSGVIVVAYWQAYTGHSFPSEILELTETVSDDSGWAVIQAWGPRVATKGGVRPSAPYLVVYKPGFRYLILTGHLYSREWNSSRFNVTSKWNKQTVQLVPFEGNDKELLVQLEDYASFMRYKREGCFWEMTPRAFVILHKMKLYLDSRQMSSSLPDRDEVHRSGCEKIVEQFKEHLQ